MNHRPQEGHNVQFLRAAMALALIEDMRAVEKPKSARRNRCDSAAEAMLRVCDLYVPGAINDTCLSRIWDVLDGPITDVLKTHSAAIFGAVEEATGIRAEGGGQSDA